MIIEFCCRSKCPAIELLDDGDVIIFEQTPSKQYYGEIIMNRDSFKDLINSAKQGKFDNLL